MAFTLDLELASRRVTFYASSSLLSLEWGKDGRGICLETNWGSNLSGKLLEIWREGPGETLNMAAFGLHLVVDVGDREELLEGSAQA